MREMGLLEGARSASDTARAALCIRGAPTRFSVFSFAQYEAPATP